MYLVPTDTHLTWECAHGSYILNQKVEQVFQQPFNHEEAPDLYPNLHPSCPAMLHPKGHRQLSETITVRRKSLSVGRRIRGDTVGIKSAVPNPCVTSGQHVSPGSLGAGGHTQSEPGREQLGCRCGLAAEKAHVI